MTCSDYEGNSAWSSAVAAMLAIGIFASYVPQQYLIVQRQSTEGLNPYFLFLMNLGSSFAFANILFLTKSLVRCCRTSLGAFDCACGFLGPLQLFAGFLGPTILIFLAARYRERGDNGRDILRFAKLIAFVDVALIVTVLAVTSAHWQHQLATYAGLASLGVGLVQYLPQLWTTFRLQHTGSLSVLMLLIQIPGGYGWCLSLAMRKGSHWSTWVPLFCAATFQLLLLLLALWFKFRQKVSLATRMTAPAHRTPSVRSTRSSPHPARESTPLLAS